MAEEWGPWVDHDGAGYPFAGRLWIEVRAAGPGFPVLCAEDWSDEFLPEVWCSGSWGRIDTDGAMFAVVQQYRVRKPRGMARLETLIADLPAHRPAPAQESEDA